MRRLLSTTLLFALTSCGEGRIDPAPAVALSELPPPAAEGSGEPYLSSGEDGVFLSWLQQAPVGGHELRMARLGPDGWGEAHTVAALDDFFVNWADFPSVVTGADRALWAHWLQREEGPGLAYGVRVARSGDGGVTWSEPWTPHEDGTPTEHGFVSLFPFGEGIGLTWLDGRKYAPGPLGEAAAQEMTVRFRDVGGQQGPGEEVVVDERTCDCCQTDVAVTDEGPIVAYRDRTTDEVRDVYVARWSPEGWTEGAPVHDDGWVIAGCPVNGPAVDASGSRVVVAWFTGAQDQPRVHAAFSDDGSRSFASPVRVDGGNPAGRVDVRFRDDGSALVSWLERTGGDQAELRVARISADEGLLAAATVSSSSSARASGFPRMTIPPWSPTAALLAWTDVSDPERSRIRVALVELP